MYLTEALMGSWFAVSAWSWGWKLAAFLLTWCVVGFVVAWIHGGASRLGGPDDRT